MNGLLHVLPASSYRNRLHGNSRMDSEPPLSIYAQIRITKLHPSTIHSPRPPIPISFSHLSIFPRPASPETTRKLFTWTRHRSRNRPGRDAKPHPHGRHRR